MTVDEMPHLDDDNLTQVAGGSAGAVVADVISAGVATGGSTALNSTVSPTGGYGDDGPLANANNYADNPRGDGDNGVNQDEEQWYPEG